MSRRRKPPPDWAKVERDVDQIMRWGYAIKELSPYHVRVWTDQGKHAVDFWPTVGRWRDPRGFNWEKTDVGLDSLRAYLAEHHPIKEDAHA